MEGRRVRWVTPAGEIGTVKAKVMRVHLPTKIRKIHFNTFEIECIHHETVTDIKQYYKANQYRG